MNQKINKWSKIIKDWKQSGLSQKRYCLEKSIKLSTFHYYKKRLPQDSAMVELPALLFRSDNPIELHLQSSNAILKIPESFNKQSLSAILDLLGVAHV
jgi:hypothetical protein